MTPELASLAAAVVRGERAAIGKAITLVESTRDVDRGPAEELLAELYPRTGHALRLGVTGVPGAGKSTLIDVLGRHALAAGRRVGVLAIDPSSSKSRGSILGDRTRMTFLAKAEQAFVRATPAADGVGALAPRSREALLVLEAAGYDFLILETVGSGQADVAVTELVDMVLLVLLAGAGDDVQAIKRGILEHADVVAFNKADGEGRVLAEAARDELASVFSWLRADAPLCRAVSARDDLGVDELLAGLLARFAELERSGTVAVRRRAQRVAWYERALERALLDELRKDDAASQRLAKFAVSVERGELLPSLAARRAVAR